MSLLPESLLLFLVYIMLKKIKHKKEIINQIYISRNISVNCIMFYLDHKLKFRIPRLYIKILLPHGFVCFLVWVSLSAFHTYPHLSTVLCIIHLVSFLLTYHFHLIFPLFYWLIISTWLLLQNLLVTNGRSKSSSSIHDFLLIVLLLYMQVHCWQL